MSLITTFPTLLVQEITDVNLRENFRRLNLLQSLLGAPLMGFTRLEITLTSEQTQFAFPHGLGFQPTDVIPTFVTGPALIQFDYPLFDKTNIYLSTVVGTPTQANPALIRCLVGAWDVGNG